MWKRKSKEAQAGKITKGGPSGFVISLVIHAALFLLAGLLVVFHGSAEGGEKICSACTSRAPKNAVEEAEGKSEEDDKTEDDTANCYEDEVGEHARYSTTRIEWSCRWIKCRFRWV